MNARLLVLQCLSPLHAGVGQGTDAVDLAIAREKATGFPYLPGSSLKGSLRAKATLASEGYTKDVFGPETDKAEEHSGAVAFGDANLVCLPVRSVYGTFAYVSSPYLLARLKRDAAQVGVSLPDLPVMENAGEVRITKNSLLKDQDNNVYFEDLDFINAGPCDAVASQLSALLFNDDKAQQTLFQKRFCLVHDNVMRFLCTHATDIVTRVSLETESKTAKRGQLWTEENLPAETLLVSLLAHLPHSRKKTSNGEIFGHLQELVKSELQLGGKSTIGRGRTQGILVGGGAA